MGNNTKKGRFIMKIKNKKVEIKNKLLKKRDWIFYISNTYAYFFKNKLLKIKNKTVIPSYQRTV